MSLLITEDHRMFLSCKSNLVISHNNINSTRRKTSCVFKRNYAFTLQDRIIRTDLIFSVFNDLLLALYSETEFCITCLCVLQLGYEFLYIYCCSYSFFFVQQLKFGKYTLRNQVRFVLFVRTINCRYLQVVLCYSNLKMQQYIQNKVQYVNRVARNNSYLHYLFINHANLHKTK